MAPEEVEDLFARLGVRQTGHFRLSSGVHSDTYLQCALALSQPAIALALGEALADRVAQTTTAVDVVVSPALGGVLAGFTVAAALQVPFLFAERDAHGAFVLRRGQRLQKGEDVLIVEDVVTTGSSAAEVADLVRAAGARVTGLASLVDRSAGVSAGMSGGRPDPPVISLYRVAPQVWSPESCPLCAGGIELDQPGSRPPMGVLPHSSRGV